MSYAIIRNEKYTKDQLACLSPHNERVKKVYSNENIDKTKSHLNYHIKQPRYINYLKEFKRLKEENNLRGQLHKNSIYACEMIITSNSEFFKKLKGSSKPNQKIQQFFQNAYDFICNYNNLGAENIISAVVHLDEKTPHMHIVFIPVVTSKDKDGNSIRKIGGYDFWKEKNSYNILQDRFYKYVTEKGYNLERGKLNESNPHREMKDLKQLTNFYETKKLESDLRQEKQSRINNQDVQDFYKYNNFTKENVDKKLISPILNYNSVLASQNHNLLLELSRAKNAIQYYKQLENQNIRILKKNQELEQQLSQNKIELHACYNVIKEIQEKNENMNKILKDKSGITLVNNRQI